MRSGPDPGGLREARCGDPPGMADPALPRREATQRAPPTSRAAAACSTPVGSSGRNGTLVYASSVGAYFTGPKRIAGWKRAGPPAGSIRSYYSRHKAEVERRLDHLRAPSILDRRVVRLRPGLIFKREAAPGFAGCSPDRSSRHAGSARAVPSFRSPTLVFQSVHAHDIGDAYRLAAITTTRRAPTTSPPTRCLIRGAPRPPLPGPAGQGAPAAALRRAPQIQVGGSASSPQPPSWLDLALQTFP